MPKRQLDADMATTQKKTGRYGQTRVNRTFVLRSNRNSIHIVRKPGDREHIEILDHFWEAARRECPPGRRLVSIDISVPCKHSDLVRLVRFDPGGPGTGDDHRNSRLRMLALARVMGHVALEASITPDAGPIDGPDACTQATE